MEIDKTVKPVKPTELTLPEKGRYTRIPELDGIRGIAILMVLLYHYLSFPLSNDTTGSPIVGILQKLTVYGWAGVDLFFVLSGFLIGGILIENRTSQNYFKTFYTRRILRIVPPYLILLFAFFTLRYFIGDPKYFAFEGHLPDWSYFTFTQNYFMGIYQGFGSEGLTPTWSLAVEEQFYLLAPLLIWLVNPKHLPVFLVSIVLLAITLRQLSGNFYETYTWFHCRMDSLAVGILLAWFYHFKLAYLKKIKLGRYYMITAGMIILFGLISYKFSTMLVLRYTLFAVLFAFIILIPLIYPDSFMGRILRTRILVKIGLISYSLYLFHNLVLGIFHQVILNNRVPQLNTISDIGVTVFAAAASLTFAWASYKLIERPAMKFGGRFKYSKTQEIRIEDVNLTPEVQTVRSMDGKVL